jgi:signal transduction protein with GAF and PtsI domain
MATPESVLGLGLTIAGVGFPAGVAMLKLWAGKTSINGSITQRQCDDRHVQTEKLFNSKLETIHAKVDALIDSQTEMKGMTQRVLDSLALPHRGLFGGHATDS